MSRARYRAFLTLVAVVAALVGATVTGDVRADEQPTLDGRWSAGPLTVKWILGDWGAACGPKPSGGGEAGAAVIVKETGGELTIAGGGRTYSTAQCWEQYPGIMRTSHSASPRGWKSTCRTAASDPRQASLTTTLTATNDSMSFYEAGQYQFVIQGQNCTASVGRYRTYTLVQRADTPEAIASAPKPVQPAPTPLPPPTAKKPEPPAQPSRCATPGPPARLEVRPARKLVRAGDEFEFRVFVSDASGCPLYVKPTWAIDSGAELAELTPAGAVKVKPGAPEGDVKLSASVGGRSAVVTLEVVSGDRYDGLLKSGAFNADGEVDEAATVAIASQSIGAASAVAEDRASGRKWIFVALVGDVAIVLAGVGLVLVRRNRRAAEAQAMQDAARRERQRAAAQAAPPPPPVAAPPAPAPVPARVPKTICPVCGEQFAGEARFCGKDGATLLPLN